MKKCSRRKHANGKIQEEKKNVCVRKKKWQSMNAVKIIAHNIIVIRDECVFSRQTVTVDR